MFPCVGHLDFDFIYGFSLFSFLFLILLHLGYSWDLVLFAAASATLLQVPDAEMSSVLFELLIGSFVSVSSCFLSLSSFPFSVS